MVAFTFAEGLRSSAWFFGHQKKGLAERELAGRHRRLAHRATPACAQSQKVAPQLAKREAVLNEAAAQFNDAGIGRTSLSDIAKAIGLTRAALYYYVDDRDELVFQCYSRAVEQAASDLDVSAVGARGLDRVVDFIRRSLSPERPPTAILGEIGYLADSAQAIVLKAHRRNASTFVQFIKSGIDDGSVRSCDAEIAGQAILGMLAWIPLSPGWSGDATATYQPRMTEALIDLVRNGVAADRSAALRCPLDVRDLAPAVGNVFDRDAVAASKVEQLLKTASQLFNRRGIEATSLDDITGQLGATKGAFYHYLRDKEELIRRCYARAFDLYDRIIDASEAAGQSGLEKSMFGLHLNVQAQVNGPSHLAPIIGALALSPRACGRSSRSVLGARRRASPASASTLWRMDLIVPVMSSRCRSPARVPSRRSPNGFPKRISAARARSRTKSRTSSCANYLALAPMEL